jgi:5-methylthioadenosine/S-adenosylhomocysteine deaminase
MQTVYFAKWILLDTGEILLNGAISVDGNTISSVGPRSKVRRSSEDRVVNLGDVLILPGLINIHTHLEESLIRGLEKGQDETFAAWSAKRNARIRNTSVDSVALSIRLQIKELLSKGITTVVDFSRLGISETVLKEESIRSWIINEIHPDLSQSDENILVENVIDRMGPFVNKSSRKGIGPQTVFSLTPAIQKKILDYCGSTGCVWATHMAESSEELQAFSERKGDLYFQITRRKPWPYGETSMGSLNYALSAGLIPNNGLLIHCNYVGVQELEALAQKQVSIAVCFQYTQMLGHKEFPLDIALKRNVSICVGTEGIAPHGFMSLFDELHALKKTYPHISALEMLKWVTVNPAKALGVLDTLGSLTPGKYADLIAVSFAHDPQNELLEELLEEEPEVVLVTVNGEELVAGY